MEKAGHIMRSDRIAYIFDWREDVRGYSWALVESCSIDGFNVRTGHSPNFLSMVNSLLSVAWGSSENTPRHSFQSLSPYPEKYRSNALNGYCSILGAERGKECFFGPGPKFDQGDNVGIPYVLPAYLEHTYLEPLNLKGLADALPPSEHREFWSISVIKAARALLGEDVDTPKKSASIPGKVEETVKSAAPQRVQSPTVKIDSMGIPMPMQAKNCTKGELRALGREQWMGEKIKEGTIVYATDGSSGDGGGSYSYVTSLGSYYVASDKAIKNNSYKAELKAIVAARDNALRHVKEGKRVLILSDNSNAVKQAKKMAIPMGVPGHLLEIRWVRGHSGHPLNQAADTIASLARKQGISDKEKKARMDGIMHMQIIQWRKHLDQQREPVKEQKDTMESYFALDSSSTLGQLWGETPISLGRIWKCNVKTSAPTPRMIFP